MNYDYAIHSDFLVYWTGKDIDNVYDQQWYESDKSKTNKSCNVTKKYLDRLYDILQFGIWMTSEDEIPICNNEISINIPSTPKSCFTELKLSQSRQHAKHYGRLGIGFKRPFLFDRNGRPVIYYGFNNTSTKDIFLNQCAQFFDNKDLLNFFKPMNSSHIFDYDYYSESEWRILYSDYLLKEKRIIDPRNPENNKEYQYFQSLNPKDQNKLRYLIPLDGWFAMIIYPSLDVKNKAQEYLSCKIKPEIERIKNLGNAIKVEGINWPIELDLDACRNF